MRWDGGDKRQRLLVERVARHVDLVPVCPEVGVGMGVPREPVQLVQTDAGVRLRGVTSGRDWTDAMETWTASTLRALEADGPLAGFVLKAKSPSCGLVVPVFGASPACGATLAQADARAGLFAAVLLRARPGLPVIDETSLADPAARAKFFAAVFAGAEVPTELSSM